MLRKYKYTALIAGCLGFTALASAETIVTFDGYDAQGWEGPQGYGGYTVIEETGGNPDFNMHTVFHDFGITYANSTNADFVQDLSGYDAVTFGLDIQVHELGSFGLPTPRPFLVELRDFDSAQGGYPWASVWYEFAWIDADNYADWTTFSVTIDDPTSTDLPAGWGGDGDYDPNTYEPCLPPGVTFADILAGYDEIAFTTFKPGWGFSDSDYDVRLDNIFINAVPAPASLSLLGLGALVSRRRR
ncbi:MAG: hypothetical protein KAS72_00630 [Phycisphaerales bacterium]|nr:hypothetical protein [Phycisphaerales bacterium]